MSTSPQRSLRDCPICRVAMVPDAEGWTCAQCGSAIVKADPVRPVSAPTAQERVLKIDEREG